MYSQCLPHGHKCMFGLIKVAHDNRLAEIAFVILIHLQYQLKHVHIDVISESGMVGDLCCFACTGSWGSVNGTSSRTATGQIRGHVEGNKEVSAL